MIIAWKQKPAGLVLAGRVVYVDDGDGFVLRRPLTNVRIRLAAIDAPEMDQPGGPEARRFLQSLVATPGVVCRCRSRDPYRRFVAVVRAGMIPDLSVHILRSGWAWAWPGSRLEGVIPRELEIAARADRRGMWAMQVDHVAPWIWRARHR